MTKRKEYQPERRESKLDGYQAKMGNDTSGYNTNKINFMIDILPTEELDKNDVEEMKRRFNRYLQLCADYNQKVTNLAAYAAIGVTQTEVAKWTQQASINPERAKFFQEVQKVCSMYREGMMADGKIHPAVGIFWQKNFDGMRDQTELTVNANQNVLGEQKDMEALKEKYLSNVAELAEGEE